MAHQWPMECPLCRRGPCDFNTYCLEIYGYYYANLTDPAKLDSVLTLLEDTAGDKLKDNLPSLNPLLASPENIEKLCTKYSALQPAPEGQGLSSVIVMKPSADGKVVTRFHFDSDVATLDKDKLLEQLLAGSLGRGVEIQSFAGDTLAILTSPVAVVALLLSGGVEPILVLKALNKAPEQTPAAPPSSNTMPSTLPGSEQPQSESPRSEGSAAAAAAVGAGLGGGLGFAAATGAALASGPFAWAVMSSALVGSAMAYGVQKYMVYSA